MNSIRRIRELNQRELENGVSSEGSWHADYRDTAYIYIGGLPLELSEGDIITIFSQYGEPTYLNLVRDKETGKSRGFAFLKYEDQRSTDLAVDNLGGAVILGRTLNVDHTRYQRKDEKREEDHEPSLELDTTYRSYDKKIDQDKSHDERPMIKEEQELVNLLRDLDDEDPMKSYFVQEKKDQIAVALAKLKSKKCHKNPRKHRIHHHGSRNRSLSRSDRNKRDPRLNDSGRQRRQD